MDVQEVYYYDTYADIPGLPENLSSTHSKLIHGKLVASKVKVLGTSLFLWTVYYYNGNVADQVFTRKNTASTPVNVTDTYNYTYDHLDRML